MHINRIQFVRFGLRKEEDADDVNVWEDNWDDDNVEDDFSQQLRCDYL